MDEAMSEMVERVAKAILRNIYESGGHQPPTWEQADKWQRAAMVGNARAAIEAMRETSAEVHRAGHSPLVPYFVEEADAYGFSQRVWEAMIDAALKS